MRAAMLSGGLRPGFAALAALLLLDGALTLGAGAEAQRRRPPPQPVEERADPPDTRADGGAEAPAARAIIPVLTEREKRCRLANECAMVGPCPPCPR